MRGSSENSYARAFPVGLTSKCRALSLLCINVFKIPSFIIVTSSDFVPSSSTYTGTGQIFPSQVLA